VLANNPMPKFRERIRQAAATPNPPAAFFRSPTILVVMAVVAALYFAREVFIPLALALLFTFLLAPLVIRLRHWHIGRVPSVLLVVLFAFMIVGTVGGLMVSQMVDLANKLPGYQENIHKKMRSLGSGDGGVLGRFNKTFAALQKELTPAPSAVPVQSGQGEAPKPVPVEIHGASFTPEQVLRTVLGSLLTILVNGFIVVVFVIFMLIEREDLRDRLIRLIGTGKLNMTTQLLDDAGHRVSRYLLMQLIVNVTYGIPIAIGLYFIGIPNPLLWGLLAALLRYIPYAGAWVATLMPFTLALAVDPGWTKPLLTIGLFAAMEVIVANWIEPWVYGASTGITPLAILAAAVFWTWLWGPVGLLLSTPLTVCLVSVGRYIPNFSFLNILLGDEPVLSPEARFYQRMLATDQEEAAEITEEFLNEKSLVELYDVMIIPALTLAEQDRQRGALDEEKYQTILQNVHFLVDDLADYNEEIKNRLAENEPGYSKLEVAGKIPTMGEAPPRVLCIPARNEADEIAGTMLAQLLDRRGVAVKTLSAVAFTAEKAELVKNENVSLICISGVAPCGLLHARHLCKRLVSEIPEISIVVGLWNEKQDPDDIHRRFPMVSPDNLVTGLKQAVERILPMVSAGNPQSNQPASISSTQELEHAK
jgi:predicted PurR-regulated permease PerM